MTILKNFFIVLFLTLCFSCSVLAEEKKGFNIEISNLSAECNIYFLYWMDHDWGHNGPANIAGGEINSGQVRLINNYYKPGIYQVVFNSKHKNGKKQYRSIFNIPFNAKKLIIIFDPKKSPDQPIIIKFK